MVADIESYVGEKKVSLYPNPANDILHVEASSMLTTEFNIFSIAGILYLEGSMEDESIDISQLPQGLYLFRLTDQTGGIANLMF